MAPKLHPRRLLTIICEADLERQLVSEFHRLGISGHTITDARGQGVHGDRDGLWPPTANIRIEVLCEESALDAVLTLLEQHYFKSYCLVVFVSDVSVLRADRF
jgi:hypothetical protein